MIHKGPAGLGPGPGPRHEFHTIGSKPGAAKAAASATKENKGECPYIKHLHTIKKLGPSSRPGPGPGTQALTSRDRVEAKCRQISSLRNKTE